MHKKEKKDSTPFLSRKKHACIATLVVILVRKTKKQGGNAHQKYSLDPLHTVSQSYKNKIPPHPPCPCTVLPRLPPKERSRVRGRDSGGRCDSVSWWLMAQLLTFTNTATKSLHWPPTHCFIVQKKGEHCWASGPLLTSCRPPPSPPNLLFNLALQENALWNILSVYLPLRASLMTPSALISLVCSKHLCICTVCSWVSAKKEKKKKEKLINDT